MAQQTQKVIVTDKTIYVVKPKKLNPVLATTVTESAVIDASKDAVWKAVNSCKFGFAKNITETKSEPNEDNVVGSLRTITYNDTDKTKQTVQIICRSDTTNKLVFRLVASEPSLSLLHIYLFIHIFYYIKCF